MLLNANRPEQVVSQNLLTLTKVEIKYFPRFFSKRQIVIYASELSAVWDVIPGTSLTSIWVNYLLSAKRQQAWQKWEKLTIEIDEAAAQ